jgi:hypothetical protein
VPSEYDRIAQLGKAMFPSLTDPKSLLAELDAENDELAARNRLASGKYNTWQSGVVSEWLRRKSEERSAAFEARAEAREEETLAIAREANRIARSASRWAMWAAIIAIIAIVIATKDQILALIFIP